MSSISFIFLQSGLSKLLWVGLLVGFWYVVLRKQEALAAGRGFVGLLGEHVNLFLVFFFGVEKEEEVCLNSNHHTLEKFSLFVKNLL